MLNQLVIKNKKRLVSHACDVHGGIIFDEFKTFFCIGKNKISAKKQYGHHINTEVVELYIK